MKDTNFKYQANDICQEYDCGKCGETLRFSNSARLDEVKKALEAHRCVPAALLSRTHKESYVPARIH